jgi:hypothetical protein
VICRSTIKCPCKNNQHKHHLIVDMKNEPTNTENWVELRKFFKKSNEQTKVKSYSSKKIKDQKDLDRLIDRFKMDEC